jgi:hypothetical protein
MTETTKAGREQFEAWFAEEFEHLNPLGFEANSIWLIWQAGYQAGRESMRAEAAAKVESMANFTGYYAGYCNDPLINAADAIRELPKEPR